MGWPTPQDYSEAIQNPRASFSDTELQVGQPDTDGLGLPRARSGGFACVYKIQSSGNQWAARCFQRDIPDQRRRYEAISNHLANARLEYTVRFFYLPNGIRIGGRDYPLLKMTWVEGETLSNFVGRSINYPETLISLAKVWRKMVDELQAAQIAHGDLQHGNVLVVGDTVQLIDYDGMYVPALAGNKSNEVGHRNYQLPSRTTNHYDIYLDNFSAWVIYLSFIALAIHPELWKAHNGGDECLIFRKEDYQDPNNSQLLQYLNNSQHDELRSLARLFTGMLSYLPQDIPPLSSTLTQLTSIEDSVIATIKPNPRVGRASDSSRSSKRQSETTASIKDGGNQPQPDNSWLFDALSDGSKVAFRNTFGKPRKVAALSSVLLVAAMFTGKFIYLAAFDTFAMVISVCVVYVGYCFKMFKDDPIFVEQTELKGELRKLAETMKQAQSRANELLSQRGLYLSQWQVADKPINDDRNRVLKSGQNEAAVLTTQLSKLLYGITNEKSRTARQELFEIQSVEKEALQKESETKSEISKLPQNEQNEIAQELYKMECEYTRLQNDFQFKKNVYVRNYLRKTPIDEAAIPSVGNRLRETLIDRLKIRGIKSADDIDNRVLDVEGIGDVRRTDLIHWKSNIELRARKTDEYQRLMKASAALLRPQLSLFDKVAIQRKFQNEKVRLESQSDTFKNQFAKKKADIQQRYRFDRQNLDKNEIQIRSEFAVKSQNAKQVQDKQIAELDNKVAANKSIYEPQINDLTEKIKSAQKEIFALQWQSGKTETDLKRFDSLTFSNYMKRLIKVR